MEFNKIQYISFSSVEEAIQVAKFLIGLGFKIEKKCLEPETYVYDMPFTFSQVFPGARRGDLIYLGFSKFKVGKGYGWKLSRNDGSIFTFTSKGKHLIRREKLKKLNNL